jgi:hypothetical protein
MSTFAHSDSGKDLPWTLKFGVIKYDYSEPGVMSINGYLLDLDGSYRYDFNSSHFLDWFLFDLDFAFGSPTYDGANVSVTTGIVTPVQEKSRDVMLNLQPKLGFLLTESGGMKLDLVFGLGYWHLTNKIQGGGAYLREITYIYFPMALEGKFQLSNDYSLNVATQYNMLLRGKVESQLSDLGLGWPDAENDLSSGSGYKFLARGTLLSSTYQPFLELYFQKWDIEQSEVIFIPAAGRVFWEPKNNTQMIGLNYGFSF